MAILPTQLFFVFPSSLSSLLLSMLIVVVVVSFNAKRESPILLSMQNLTIAYLHHNMPNTYVLGGTGFHIAGSHKPPTRSRSKDHPTNYHPPNVTLL